jgi:prephenate dehydrogenase
MRTVAIVGVGLIGGSFALALRKAGFDGEILGVSSEPTLAAAITHAVIDRGATLNEAIVAADLIYLAQPISRILETIPLLDAAKPTALITDAGSTKTLICKTAERPGRRAQFLGGHPMAGKESRGVQAADAELFRGRTYFLTPRLSSELETDAAAAFVSWLRRISANVHTLSPTAHDHLVSFTSHLPQIASTALAISVSERLGPSATTAAGPGLLDMTRLAMSSYEIWSDIIATNRSEIDQALLSYIERLQDIRAHLNDNLSSSFEIATDLAKSLRKR